MEELQAKWTFDQGGFAKCVISRAPMGVGFNLFMMGFGRNQTSQVLTRQRGGARLFRSLDAAVSCANGIGFRRVEVDLT